MTPPLSLSQWLSASRSDETPIAWLGEQTWTLGQLRYDVSILLDRLRQQEADRWALCFENSYLFIVALLAVLYAGKTPVIPGHRRLSLLEEQRSLFSGVLSDAELCWSEGLLVVASAQKSAPTKICLPAIAAYMLAGKSTPEEIIASVEYGLYAPNFGGGQVDITSGKFVFSTTEAYLIEKGRITKPVKGATLIGSGIEAMQQISMVGNDLALDKGVGVCGKEGQSVPVGVGQPTLKLDTLTVGGTA